MDTLLSLIKIMLCSKLEHLIFLRLDLLCYKIGGAPLLRAWSVVAVQDTHHARREGRCQDFQSVAARINRETVRRVCFGQQRRLLSERERGHSVSSQKEAPGPLRGMGQARGVPGPFHIPFLRPSPPSLLPRLPSQPPTPRPSLRPRACPPPPPPTYLAPPPTSLAMPPPPLSLLRLSFPP